MDGFSCDWLNIHLDWLLPLLDQFLNILTITSVWAGIVFLSSPPTTLIPSLLFLSLISIWGSQNTRWQEHSYFCRMCETFIAKLG